MVLFEKIFDGFFIWWFFGHYLPDGFFDPPGLVGFLGPCPFHGLFGAGRPRTLFMVFLNAVFWAARPLLSLWWFFGNGLFDLPLFRYLGMFVSWCFLGGCLKSGTKNIRQFSPSFFSNFRYLGTLDFMVFWGLPAAPPAGIEVPKFSGDFRTPLVVFLEMAFSISRFSGTQVP